jgi:uracil-DNA glycosylase
MNPDSVNIHPSWKEQLKAEFSSPYFQQIKDFLLSEYQKGFITFPLGKDIFRAFDLTPFDQVKVVILGQDPYHGV